MQLLPSFTEFSNQLCFPEPLERFFLVFFLNPSFIGSGTGERRASGAESAASLAQRRRDVIGDAAGAAVSAAARATAAATAAAAAAVVVVVVVVVVQSAGADGADVGRPAALPKVAQLGGVARLPRGAGRRHRQQISAFAAAAHDVVAASRQLRGNQRIQLKTNSVRLG